jgi:hypothetical protein
MQGRSSDSPDVYGSLPILHSWTVADHSRKRSRTRFERGYSGGTAPDSHGIPYYAPFGAPYESDYFKSALRLSMINATLAVANQPFLGHGGHQPAGAGKDATDGKPPGPGGAGTLHGIEQPI